MINHAYAHWIGRTVGIDHDGNRVFATVMTPEPGQDHNDLLVSTIIDGRIEWMTVRAMDTYHRDFVR